MLRWIFIVLFIVNVIFAALFFQDIRSLFSSDEPEEPIATKDKKQSLPRKTEIKRQEVTSVTADQPVCIEVRGFKDQQGIASTKKWLKRKGLFARERTRVVVTNNFYRVYVGKFNSRAEAQKGLTLLRQQSEHFTGSLVFQYAPADWRISLNVFPDQSQAEKYLAAIQQNIGGLKANIESQNKGKEELYLVMTETTAEQFLQDYQSADFHQHIQQSLLVVDQCLAR